MKTDFEEIVKAYARISEFLPPTPLVTSKQIDRELKNHLVFKCEGFQPVGAFKCRGALNFLLQCRDSNSKEVVAYSSGNHAQAVAWAGNLLGFRTKVFIPQTASPFKIAATKGWGSEVVITSTRQQAEQLAQDLSDQGHLLVPPYDHDWIIAGQGTALYETQVIQKQNFNLVGVPVGGGGLASGCLIAGNGSLKIIGGEPEEANDAFRSLQTGHLYRWSDTPKSIADGACTLSLSDKTFSYLQDLEKLYTFTEVEIIEATRYLTQNLKIVVEPTSALGFLAVKKYLKIHDLSGLSCLVILSGANIDISTQRSIWREA